MLTKEELDERKPFMGASDAARILNVSPFGCGFDVYAEKKLDYEQFTSPAADLGDWLEDPLIDWFCQATETDPTTVQRNTRFYRNPDTGEISKTPVAGCIFTAQHDGIILTNPLVGIEAKTSGLLNPFFRSEDFGWGETSVEEPTDKVPDHVIVQTQHQMYVSDLSHVFVPALITNEGRRLYRVNRDDELIATIIAQEREFYGRYIAGDEQPEVGERAPSLDLMKRIKRHPGEIIEPSEEANQFFGEWLVAKEGKSKLEKLYKEATARLLASISDAEGARFPGHLFTYLEQRGADKLDLKRLKAEWPEVYETIATPNHYRVPRVKKETVSDDEGTAVKPDGDGK